MIPYVPRNRLHQFIQPMRLNTCFNRHDDPLWIARHINLPQPSIGGTQALHQFGNGNISVALRDLGIQFVVRAAKQLDWLIIQERLRLTHIEFVIVNQVC